MRSSEVVSKNKGMRICAFSDIHGNLPAFRIAYEMILSERADMNLFLGDLCGYYFDQIEIWSMLQKIPNLIALKGNHDEMLLRIVHGEKGLLQAYLKRYGNSMEHLLCSTIEGLVRWFSGLPSSHSWAHSDLSSYHGSPWDPLEGYVYPDSSLDRFNDYPASVFILGHTHYPMVKTVKDKLIMNPGSLGQPRHGGWPTYAVLDYPTRHTQFKVIPYDKTEVLKEVDELDRSNQYLKKILFR